MKEFSKDRANSVASIVFLTCLQLSFSTSTANFDLNQLWDLIRHVALFPKHKQEYP